MKNFVLFTVAALATSAIASVTVSAGNTCGTVTTETIGTEAGVCYTTGSDEWHSAKGCSKSYSLRIHRKSECADQTDAYDAVAGECTTFDDGSAILSFKCV